MLRIRLYVASASRFCTYRNSDFELLTRFLEIVKRPAGTMADGGEFQIGIIVSVPIEPAIAAGQLLRYFFVLLNRLNSLIDYFSLTVDTITGSLSWGHSTEKVMLQYFRLV